MPQAAPQEVHVEPAPPEYAEEEETGAPPAVAEAANGCFLAFVPTASAYRLVELDGAPPAVGAEVSVDGSTDRLVVARVVQSPLPLDRRPCVYLEAVPSFGARDDA